MCPRADRAPQLLADFYVVEHQIGKGSYGEVFLGHDVITHEPCAIKVIKKNPFNRKQKKFIDRESAIMKTVDNPYIVQTMDVFESHGADGSLTIVSEYCGGGELFDLIIASQCFTEDKARHIMRQVLMGVDYLHSRGIVHRYVWGRGRGRWGGRGRTAVVRNSGPHANEYPQGRTLMCPPCVLCTFTALGYCEALAKVSVDAPVDALANERAMAGHTGGGGRAVGSCRGWPLVPAVIASRPMRLCSSCPLLCALSLHADLFYLAGDLHCVSHLLWAVS